MGLAIEVPGTVFANAKWATGLAAVRRSVLPIGGAVDGFWFDPWDLGSLFQDAAGTIPVTASGQRVGLMLDKSGNNNHARQTDNAKRPTFLVDGDQKFLQFDGTQMLDAVAASGSWPLAKRTLIMALRYEGGDVAGRTLAEAFDGNPNTNPYSWMATSFELFEDGADHKLNMGADYPSSPDVAAAYPVGVDDVVSCRLDYVDDATAVPGEIRSNGAVVFANAALDPVNGGTPVTGIRIFAGREGGDTLAGRLYGMAYIRSYVDPAPVEDAMAERANITLGG